MLFMGARIPSLHFQERPRPNSDRDRFPNRTPQRRMKVATSGDDELDLRVDAHEYFSDHFHADQRG
jgi:hypothetical protein